jgi:hypothetical protein
MIFFSKKKIFKNQLGGQRDADKLIAAEIRDEEH